MHVLILYLRDLPLGCSVLMCFLFFGFWFPDFLHSLNETGMLHAGRVMEEMWA